MSLITENDSSRVMLFIDLRNVFSSAKKECSFDPMIDLCSMSKILAGNRRIVGAYVFDGSPGGENIEKQTRFHHCLQHMGFRLIARDSFESETRAQKEVDVALACEMLDHAVKDHYDTAIIVSGDRDFVPVVEFVQRYGKTVEVAGFKQSLSSALVRAADVSYNLSSMPIITGTVPEEASEPEVIEEASAESVPETVAENVAEAI